MANSFTFKEFSAIFKDMKNAIVAGQTVVTDWNESSLLYQMTRAVASEIARLYLEARAGYDLQLINLAFSVFGFSRKSAVTATGTVTLTASKAPTTDYTLAAGFQIEGGGNVYETTEDVVLSAGSTSISSVAVECTSSGSDGNIASGTTLTVVSADDYITTATLAAAITNGTDEESNSSVLRRFRKFVTGLGRTTPTGIEAAVLAIDGVFSVNLVELWPGENLTYTDPTTQASVTKMVHAIMYAESGSGAISSDLLATIQAAIDGTDGDGGCRATGVNLIAQAPTLLSVDIVAAAVRSSSYAEDSLLTLAKTAITNYVNNLSIGDDLVFSMLYAKIMAIPGIADVSFTSPTATVSADDNQVIRINSISIAFSVEGS